MGRAPVLGALLACVAIAVIGACEAVAQAADYPAREIRIVVPYPPAGGNDTIARLFAQHLFQRWKRAVVVENRPGAGGSIGTAVVSRASPDGYTLLSASLSHGMAQALFKNVTYDVERDFAPVFLVGESTNLVLANLKQNFDTLADLVAFARANPGKLTVATAGMGSSSDLFVRLLKTEGIDVVAVPYPSTSRALTDVMAGQVDAVVDPMSSSLQLARSGKLKLLGVTSARRVPFLPDVPTLAEVGLPGADVVGWYGFFAPAGTAPEIIGKLNAECERILQEPDIRERLQGMAVVPAGGPPERLGALVHAELTKWTALMQKLKIPKE